MTHLVKVGSLSKHRPEGSEVADRRLIETSLRVTKVTAHLYTYIYNVLHMCMWTKQNVVVCERLIGTELLVYMRSRLFGSQDAGMF